ncbi:YfhO family protein [Reichenbachiella sp.]|uniref:YfhO family protein n=1 Tax=Reichenbachiella sp. TaxID=2184521 RepID=UPI003BB1B3EA
MLNLSFKKDILPHLAAVFIFLVVTLIFFAPVVFEDKELPQHDITQWRGGAQELIDYREKTGEEGLWTNSMFGGMPAYLVSIKFSGEFLSYPYEIYKLGLPNPLYLVFTALLSFYIMMRCFQVRTGLAVAAALAFGFTGFIIISVGAGHNMKVAAVAFMPLVLGGIHLALDRNRIWGAIITALGLAMQLKFNHLQITYYLLILTVLYGIFALIAAIKQNTQKEFFKTIGMLVIAAFLAVGANFGKLWSVIEYSPYSIRGKTELSADANDRSSGLDKSYAFQYSNGIFEPIVLFIPNYFGGSSRQDLGNNSNLEEALRKNGLDNRQIANQVKNAPAYWGDQPLTAPYYAGAIVVFLFVLGMLVLEGRIKYWLIAGVAVGIVLSWGSNFASLNYLLFDYLPGYNKFRSVTFTIIMTVCCLVIGGFIGLEKVLSMSWSKQLQQKLLIAFAATGGFALLASLFAGIGGYSGAVDQQLAAYPEWFLTALKADRQSLLQADAWRTFFFVMAAAVLIWLSLKGKLKSQMAVIALAFLVGLDMFTVSKRFISNDSFERKSKNHGFAASEADQRILKDSDKSYRVYNLINGFNDAKTSYFHQSIGGYHGAKMRRYQDLIEEAISPETSMLIDGLQKGVPAFDQIDVLNMLNTKYFLAGTTANAVIPNPAANGNAWFVSDVVEVTSADEEMEKVNSMDTKSTAVIDGSKFDLSQTSYGANGTIALEDYKPNRLTYISDNSENGFAVFSEIYYENGWVARIDGNEVPIHRVNYVLRGLEVPSGKHQIEFEFRPKSYYTGNVISGISSAILMLLFLGAIGHSVRKEQS